MLFQALPVGRKTEIVDILADALNLRSGFLYDAIVIDIRVAEKCLIRNRVPAFIDAKIDVTGLFKTLEHFANNIFVTVFACPDERVIATIEELPGFDKAL